MPKSRCTFVFNFLVFEKVLFHSFSWPENKHLLSHLFCVTGFGGVLNKLEAVLILVVTV